MDPHRATAAATAAKALATFEKKLALASDWVAAMAAEDSAAMVKVEDAKLDMARAEVLNERGEASPIPKCFFLAARAAASAEEY